MNPSSPELQSANDLIQWITGLVAEASHASPDDIDPDKPFVELGLDSISAVSLAGDIEHALGLDLPPTALWEYPTISALASHLWPMCGNHQSMHGVA